METDRQLSNASLAGSQKLCQTITHVNYTESENHALCKGAAKEVIQGCDRGI